MVVFESFIALSSARSQQVLFSRGGLSAVHFPFDATVLSEKEALLDLKSVTVQE